MVFNGHTTESIARIDENTMGQIVTMYADGLLGNSRTLTILGQLTAGIFNYIRPQNSNAYTLKQILGMAHDYIYPPLSPEEQKQITNNNLKAYMMQAPGFKQSFFEGKNG